ncbi:MAG: DNA cytosine methyltransferase [Roseobacter sp.]|uniref:DNA cytosine methyltransferase n=1 Tax=Hyphomonas sp. TaxID=87 RepID=UPI00329871E7
MIDLFAGPGGLAEGFSSVMTGGKRLFDVVLSVEMEQAAHQTLTLRAFTRQFPAKSLPDEYYSFVAGEMPLEELYEYYPKEWASARKEALRLQLGTPEAAKLLQPKIDRIKTQAKGRTILIGGPPCQAYSLVGRARNAGNADYKAEDDGRHFLYREYIEILDRLRPAAFVMENVKGILSSAVAGGGVFERIIQDLKQVGIEDGGYKLMALAPSQESSWTSPEDIPHSDFIVRTEHHQVPQSRHRVIVVGLRADIASEIFGSEMTALLERREPTSVREVLGGMPELRSGLSKGDDQESWRRVVQDATAQLLSVSLDAGTAPERKRMTRILKSVAQYHGSNNMVPSRSGTEYDVDQLSKGLPEKLSEFLIDGKLTVLAHHTARGHMKSDLARYLFCSAFSEVHSRSPKAADFPAELAPNHKSWCTGKFADRFRVQGWEKPSTTITSHISKDGHYYIHPDPKQCRSLTVREAARLQTFPDNYLFLGTRTQQYVQVGNAVPPFIAKQIAEALKKILP